MMHLTAMVCLWIAALSGIGGLVDACNPQPDFNNHGHNIGEYGPVWNAEQCCDKCKAESGCAGWTFVKVNGQCWLKSEVSWVPHYDPAVVSGTVDHVSHCPLKNPNQNNHGVNIGDFGPVLNAEQCCDKCSGQQRCVGWTFVLSNKQCWLKTSVGRSTYDPDTVSGTVGPNPSCLMHPNQNNHGRNIGDYGPVSNAEQCCDKCKAEIRCVGWTFVSNNRQCWLKSSVDELVYDWNGVVSGTLYKSGGDFGASAANETLEASNVTSSTTSIMSTLAMFVVLLHYVLLF